MKTIKKISVVLFAFVMAITVALFAACTPVESGNDKKNDTVVNVDAERLVSALLNQPKQYVEFKLNADIESVTDSGTANMVTTATGKLNLTNGSGDIVATSKIAGLDEFSAYNYVFLRDWEAYTCKSTNAITDFTADDLTYEGSAYEFIENIPELSGIDLGMLASSVAVPLANATIVQTANELNALTIANGKATIDVNLMVYNALLKFKAFFDKINDNTTLGQFLALDEVKSLIEVFTAGMLGADLQMMIAMMLTEIESAPWEDGSDVTVGQKLAEHGIDLGSLAVAADANSSAYDYIIKFISSDEINTFLDTMLEISGAGFSMPANLKDVKLSFIMNKLEMPSIESCKQALNMLFTYVTATEITLPSEGEDTVISGVKIVYTLNGNNVLTEQKIDATVRMLGKTPSESENGTVTVSDIAVNSKISVTVTYPSSAPVLTDLSAIISSGDVL